MKGNTLARIAAITAIIAGVSLLIASAIGFASGTFQSIANGTFRPFDDGRTGGVSIDEKRYLLMTGMQSIRVRAVSENIVIREGSGDTIMAWFQGRVSSTDPADRPHLQVSQQGDMGEISIKHPRRTLFGRSYWNGSLEISIPKGYMGRLSIEGVSGDITMRSGGGRELEVRTVSGSIRADDVRSVTEAADINSTSGDVWMNFEKIPSRIDVETVSGDIRLGMLADASFKLDAESTSGDATCSFPMTLTSLSEMRDGHSFVGTVGDGKGSIRAKSVSGDIAIIRN